MNKPRYIDLEKLTARLPMLSDDGDLLVSVEDVRKAISLAAADPVDVCFDGIVENRSKTPHKARKESAQSQRKRNTEDSEAK